jgi:hypothetical protein
LDLALKKVCFFSATLAKDFAALVVKKLVNRKERKGLYKARKAVSNLQLLIHIDIDSCFLLAIYYLSLNI